MTKSWFSGNAVLDSFASRARSPTTDSSTPGLSEKAVDAGNNPRQEQDEERRAENGDGFLLGKAFKATAKKLPGECRENALIFAALADRPQIIEILLHEDPWPLLWSESDISRAQIITSVNMKKRDRDVEHGH
ncbi:unnamed protein product [Amoebophrya sp. A25]|nr:unnamed protein product [Amoebophrya sp. A25]|eukprot:GSA25T00006039001.1